MSTVSTLPRLEASSCMISDAVGATQDVATTWSWFVPDLNARYFLTTVTPVVVGGDPLDQAWWDSVYDYAVDRLVEQFPTTSVTAPNPVVI